MTSSPAKGAMKSSPAEGLKAWAAAQAERPAKPSGRVVALREERNEGGYRWLGPYIDEAGRLYIDGQDIGPGTAPVSGDGEYEWFQTIAAADVAKLVALLDGEPGTDVLDLLEQGWTGSQSYEQEKRLRESDIQVHLNVWSG